MKKAKGQIGTGTPTKTKMKKVTFRETRYHKILFDLDKPFGHKVQRDRTKTIPRKHKYKNIEE